MAKEGSSRADAVAFVAKLLKSDENMPFAEMKKRAKAEGHHLYPLIVGLARKELGWAPSAKAKAAKKAPAAAGAPVKRGPGRPPKAKPVAEAVLLPATLEARPARLFQKPAPLHADLTPDGLLSHVTLQGRRRRVEAIEGPERLVGQWWSPDAVARDYYRVRLEGVGVLWVFKDGADGRFFAHGVFD